MRLLVRREQPAQIKRWPKGGARQPIEHPRTLAYLRVWKAPSGVPGVTHVMHEWTAKERATPFNDVSEARRWARCWRNASIVEAVEEP